MERLQAIQMDINNSCNARCRFCINDWKKADPAGRMKIETFDKIVEILPLIERGFLSCSFEPTIHPQFIEIYSRVPKGTGAYTFITTNLAKEFSDCEIHAMSKWNLDSLTISLGSLDSKTYEELHAGSKFDTFKYNLDRIDEVFKQEPEAPRLRFITVVFNQNKDELEHMAEITFNRYRAFLHQFRTPFKHTKVVKKGEWLDKAIISQADWNVRAARLEKMPYNIVFFNPLFSDEAPPGITPLTTYFTCRYDGTIIFHEKNKSRLPERFRKEFNINDIEDPGKYFKEGIQEIK